MRAIPASEREASLASLAEQIADPGDRRTIDVVVKP
jgi:hypothetical protein